MLSKINDISIKLKILIIVLVNYLFLFYFSYGFISKNFRKHYLEERKLNLKEKVGMVTSLTTTILKQFEMGEITRNEAEKIIINIVSNLIPSQNEYFFIFNDKNIMIYHPDPELLNRNLINIKDEQNKYFFKEMLEGVNINNSIFVDYYWKKPDTGEVSPKITYAEKIPNTNWIIASGIYVDDIEKDVSDFINRLILYGFIFFVISFIIIYVFLQFLLKKIENSKKIYEEVKQGNFLYKEENYNNNDEIGTLLKTINGTIQYISNFFDKIVPISIRLEANTKNIRQSSSETKLSIENQYKHFEQISSSMEETSVTISEISKLLNETNLEASQSMEVTNKTLRISNDTGVIINKINDIFTNLLTQFDVIQKDSNEIQQVLTILKDIAEQTNLIALNASIEAAKSGESGSRFSVIAEEIRKLSQNSKESTQKISNTIQSIIDNINNFRDEINRFGGDIKNAKDNTQELLKVLKDLIQVFQNINLRINQLASSTEELDTTSKDIAKNVEVNLTELEKIMKLSERVADLSKELVDIREELRSATMNIKTKSYNKFIFDLARTDHEVYVGKIEEFLDDKRELTVHDITEYTKCRFGKWYYSPDSKDFMNLKEFKDIEEPHKNVHQIAQKIYSLKKDNQNQKAKELLPSLQEESQKIITLLNQIKNKTVGS